tara:strand:+ start:65 stop:355 length:291 start_codon:yes stop_codon:yes gene_type:complete
MILPIRGKVAIKPVDPEEMTSGGVIMPDISQEGVSKGKVLAVGPGQINFGKEVEPMCKVGDLVSYPKRGAYSIDIEEEEVLVINELDIHCIIKRGE